MDILTFLGVPQGGVLGLVGVVLFFVLLYGLGHLPKKKYSFAVRVLMGTAAGTAVGLLVHYVFPQELVSELGAWFSFVTRGYILLFVALILPMVFLASARLVLHDKVDRENPGKTKWKKWVNTLMVALSASIAAALGMYFQVGRLSDAVLAPLGESATLTGLVSGLFPAGLGRDLVLCNVIGIFVFGIYVGKATLRMSGKHMDTVKPVMDLIEGAFSVGVSVCKTVIAYKSMGAAAIMAALTVEHGVEIVLVIVKMLLVLCLGALIMLCIQLVLCALSGVGPVRFLRESKGVMLKAIKTRTGSACLADAQQVLSEGLGLNKEVTDEVAAYTIVSGMQGCGALFPATATIFALAVSGYEMTAPVAVLMVLVITLVSYGITDLPGTATMSEFASVIGIGMFEAAPGLGAMIAIDPIGDVPRTLINVTGCMTNAIIVERRVRK